MAGTQTSSVCHGDNVPEPGYHWLGGGVTLGSSSDAAAGAPEPARYRLGSNAASDSYPGPVGRVSGLTTQYLPAAGEPRLWGLS